MQNQWHDQKNGWCEWPCLCSQWFAVPTPLQEPFHQLMHLTDSISGLFFLFSHFLDTCSSAISHPPCHNYTSYSLPKLLPTYTETLAWDTSLHSYRRKGANIFEEHSNWEGFCYHFPWLIQVGEHRKLSVTNKILGSQCLAYLSMLWRITCSLIIYTV